jgi:hypothetical protein
MGDKLGTDWQKSFEDALKDSDMRLKLESSASTRPINVCMGKMVLSQLWDVLLVNLELSSWH